MYVDSTGHVIGEYRYVYIGMTHGKDDDEHSQS